MQDFSYFCVVFWIANKIEIIAGGGGGVVPPWGFLWMEDIKLESQEFLRGTGSG